MAGVNNIAFREMCGKFHDGINFTEMVSSTAFFLKVRKQKKYLKKEMMRKKLGFRFLEAM